MIARNAYFGRPRWNTLAPSASNPAHSATIAWYARADPSCGKRRPQQELDRERADRQLRQHQHDHQRQVRVPGAHLVEVRGQEVAREARAS